MEMKEKSGKELFLVEKNTDPSIGTFCEKLSFTQILQKLDDLEWKCLGFPWLLKCWTFWAGIFFFPVKWVELEASLQGKTKANAKHCFFSPRSEFLFSFQLYLHKTDGRIDPSIFYLHKLSDFIPHYFVGQYFYLSWSL